MGQVPGKVEFRCYVYPETKQILQAIATRGSLRFPNGRWDLGSALEKALQETLQRHQLGIPKDNPSPPWDTQAQAIAEREYQRDLRRKAASMRANSRRRAAERSTRYLDPNETD